MPPGDNSGIYEDLIRFKPDGMTPNGWATRAGVSRTVWADMRRHGNPSRRTLEKLLTAAGSSLAEFEALRIGGGRHSNEMTGTHLGDHVATWGAAQLPALPLLHTAAGGEWGDAGLQIELTELRSDELVERLPRPPNLANDHSAYAVTVAGHSMWPRFRPGRRVAVSPKAAVVIGDDVLLKLNNGNAREQGVLIKELVRRGANGVDLRQFNPDVTFHVAAEEIVAIEKIVGELI